MFSVSKMSRTARELPTDAFNGTSQKDHLSNLLAELRLLIFSYVLPRGVPSLDTLGATYDYIGMINEDGGGSRRLSLSVLRTSKQIHRECTELFWKRVVLNLDKAIVDHDTRTRLTSIGLSSTNSTPLPWTTFSGSISANAKHVTFTLDFVVLLPSTIRVALEELADWSQVERISLKADYSLFHPRFWCVHTGPRVWTEDFFQPGGRLSHIRRTLHIYLYTPANGSKRYKVPLPFKNDPGSTLNEFSRALMCDVLVDGQQIHLVDSLNSRKDERGRHIQSMFIKTLLSNGDKFWVPRYFYYKHIAELVLGTLELYSILDSVKRSATTGKSSHWEVDAADELHRKLKSHPWCTRIIEMEIDNPRFLERHDWLCRYWRLPLDCKHGLALRW